MRTLRRRASLVLALVTAAIAPASASELFVMPYSCIVAGGRPLLSPGPEQSHQIIGRREQRTFTACSPVNRDMCRTWTVHRFDLDCDGARVPWTDVVASANHDRRSQRVWVDEGRLVVRMPPSWSFEEDDPCARRSRYFDGFGRMRRYCDDRRSMAPPPVVAMPAGFAPMLGIEGYFVTTAPSVSAAPPVPTAPPVTSAPEPAPPPKTARTEIPDPLRPEPTQPKVQDTAPKPPPTAPTQSAPAPKVSAPAPIPPVPKPAVRPAPPTEGDAVVPKVINRNDTVASLPAPVPAEKTAPQPDAITTGTISKAQQPATSETTSGALSLLTFSISPATGAFAAFMVLTTALLVLFFMARRREHLQAAGRPRDVAAAPLYAPRPRASGTVTVRQPQPPPPSQPVRYAAPAFSSNIPRTRNEAIEILGMGVVPDTSLAAMKKIVDGLRQSWHPDLARDEADRALRELRIKQINAAWDIISGKRSEV
jgi:hypothetical protein